MCTKNCSSDESVKVLIQTSSVEGKDNALNCSVAIEGYQPLEIAMSAGYIIGMPMCESDKEELMQENGIVNIENDYVVTVDDGYN